MAYEWRTRAKCRTEDFSDGDPFYDPANYAKAQLICSQCPVSQMCLSYAMKAEELYGVWGGKTPEQRRDIRRQAQRMRRIRHQISDSEFQRLRNAATRRH